MDGSLVTFRREGSVAVLTLDRPQRLNAVVPPLVDDLLAGFDRARSEGARSVVLTGAGRAFCAGHDLKEAEPQDGVDAARRRIQRVQDVTRAVRAHPGIVVAAVHGYALGAGCEFALGCDLVVAGDDAVFGFPEVAAGLSVTGGISALLPLTVGPWRAKRMIAAGERYSATDLHRLGLVDTVTPAGRHLDQAMELAETLAHQPAGSLYRAKRLIDASTDRLVEESLNREVDTALETLGTPEAAAGRDRFAVRGEGG